MKPIEFPEQNLVVAKDQPQYQPLPVFYNRNSVNGEMISCWKLTWRERFKILWSGKFYSCLLTFHRPLAPQSHYVNKWEVLDKKYFDALKK